MTDGASPPPPSLQREAVRPLWQLIRSRLDRYGSEHRAKVSLGRLNGETSLVLRSLLGRASQTVDLAELERALVARGIGTDLDAALTTLGCPPEQDAADRRARRARVTLTRNRIVGAVTGWPEPWASQWAAALAASGALSKLEPERVEPLVSDVRRVLDFLDHGSIVTLSRSRTGRLARADVAALALGDAHKLDSRTLLERACRRALALRLDDAAAAVTGVDTDPSESRIWESSGIEFDRVSSPILTWGLDLEGANRLAGLARASTEVGVPFPITSMALQRHPLAGLGHRGPILFVENPRVVEAAADALLDLAVITTNGNPRRNVTSLVSQLLRTGNEVHYHGDFDSAGLAICGRMVQLGCRPYAMAEADYGAACDLADAAGVPAVFDQSPAAPTPWSPGLAHAFNEEQNRRVIHEELVLSQFLAPGLA